MIVRSRPKNHCEGCRMYRPLCLCAEIPKLRVATRMVVLMHWQERWLTSNTASLACMALPNSEILFRGERGRAPDLNLLARPNTGLLYPAEGATELTPEVVAALPRPFTFIVPDGTWRQASRVLTREPGLAELPRFCLPPGPPSTYRLRHSPHEKNLSTFEAIARTLGILEGPEIQARLEELFLLKVERTLWSRGKLRARECTRPIPPAAILSHQTPPKQRDS